MRIITGTLLAAALLLAGCGILKAEPIMGEGLVCDTAEQVEQFMKLPHSDQLQVGASLEKINAGLGKPACAIVTVRFERGKVVKRITDPADNSEVEITEINVVGFMYGGLVMELPSPLKQYTPFPVTGVKV